MGEEVVRNRHTPRRVGGARGVSARGLVLAGLVLAGWCSRVGARGLVLVGWCSRVGARLW